MKHKEKGAYINHVGDNYYLYAAHSERIKGTDKMRRGCRMIADSVIQITGDQLAYVRAKFSTVSLLSCGEQFYCSQFNDEVKSLSKTFSEATYIKKSVKIRYYITSISKLSLTADAIREQWGVENKLHWHLDHTFYEDDNSTMDNKAFCYLSLLNKMCLSLCKLSQSMTPKNSLRIIRKRFAWDFEKELSALLNTFDNAPLADALQNIAQKKGKQK